MFFFDGIFYNLLLLGCSSDYIVMCFRDKAFLYTFGLTINLLSLTILLSSIFMCFYDLIFFMLFILNEDYSSFFDVFVKPTFFYSQNLGFGSFTAKNLRTFGHFIGSRSFTSPSSALKEDRLASIPLRIAVQRSYEAEGLISSSVMRHILIRFFIWSEQQSSGIYLYFPSQTFLYREGKSEAMKGILRQHIQQRRTPRDQISHLQSYFLPCHIQGAVQQGVPV